MLRIRLGSGVYHVAFPVANTVGFEAHGSVDSMVD